MAQAESVKLRSQVYRMKQENVRLQEEITKTQKILKASERTEAQLKKDIQLLVSNKNRDQKVQSSLSSSKTEQNNMIQFGAAEVNNENADKVNIITTTAFSHDVVQEKMKAKNT